MSKKFCAAILFGILITCAATGLSYAVVITPDLQQAMQSAGPAGDVSVIINLADRVDLSSIAAVAPDQKAGNDKVRKRKAIVDALKAKANLTQGFLKTLLQNRGAKKMKPLWITNSIAATVSASVISELMSLPEIESIELDSVVQAPVLVPTAVANEWNISRIHSPELWNAGISGSGVVVASLDTGVDVTHPDLGPKWRGGGCGTPPDCDSWFDPYTNSIQPYDKAGSGTGHGTGTMGVMVGNSATDAYGVAPGAKWIAAKIFDDNRNSTYSNIAQALQWLIAPGGNVLNAPDIVNNSWGFDSSPNQCINIPLLPPLPSTLEMAIQSVHTADIAIVFAAGNSGPNPSTSVSPANYKGNFAVGATDSTNNIALFSSRGPSACPDRTTSFPNVVAPGVNIYTSAPSGTYKSWEGTSFSAPHVSGAMALLVSAFPELTPAQLEAVLEQTALHLIGSPPDDTVPNNIYGYGLIDVASAYKSTFVTAKGNIPQIISLPSSWVFGNTATGSGSPSSVFIAVNQGTADLVIAPGPGGISLTGPDTSNFIVTSDGCSGVTVPSLGSCSLSVAFFPTSGGLKSAALTIDSNDAVNPSFDIPMSGRGVIPDTVARVQGTTIVAKYSVIQTAYDNCANADTIEMESATFYESPDFNSLLNIAVNLQGGYDPSFGSQIGFTILQGTLTISRGTVTVGNLILQ